MSFRTISKLSLALSVAAMAASPAVAAKCRKSQSHARTTAAHAAVASHVTTEAPTIVGAAAANEDFTTLVAAVKAAGLVETLNSEGPFTVFAPTNAAFAKLPKGTVETLLKPENKDQLISILTYHVVAGNVPSSQAVRLTEADTVQGAKLPLKVVGKSLMVGGAKVVKADLACSNGVIHVIDAVLLPPAEGAATDASVSTTQMPNIVEIAAGNSNFSTLVAAVQAAGLVDTLQGDGPFTVFAPTNEAFAKLPAGTLEMLLKPEYKEKLVSVLTYHVVPGKVMSSEAVKLSAAKTAQGQELTLKLTDAGLMIDGATVIKADIEASNGVIHVIDSVVLPK